MQKYYYYYLSEEEIRNFELINAESKTNINPKCRKFANGIEFTFQTSEAKLPTEFDDYVLVLKTKTEATIIDGTPYYRSSN